MAYPSILNPCCRLLECFKSDMQVADVARFTKFFVFICLVKLWYFLRMERCRDMLIYNLRSKESIYRFFWKVAPKNWKNSDQNFDFSQKIVGQTLDFRLKSLTKGIIFDRNDSLHNSTVVNNATCWTFQNLLWSSFARFNISFFEVKFPISIFHLKK